MFYGFSNEAGQRAVSGAAIVFQRGGDHPHDGSDEVNAAAWPRPLPHRVNCGQMARLCYLSLPPDYRPEAEAITPTPHPAEKLPLSAPPVRKPVIVVSVCGLSLAKPSVSKDEVLWSQTHSPEGARCLETVLSQDHTPGFLPFNAGQLIRGGEHAQTITTETSGL